MRQIVDGNEGLNIMLNEIANKVVNETIDKMMEVVKAWKQNTDVVSCDTILYLLEINKAK